MRFRSISISVLLLILGSCSAVNPTIGIVMEVDFDQPVPPAYAADIKARFGAASADPAPITVKCDSGVSWSNAVGTYSVQWACGSPYAPWSFQLSSDAQSIAAGNVDERGLKWTLDGKKQPQQSPHLGEYPGSTWHGRYNGLTDGSKVTYQDELTFRHALGTGGNITVTLSGTHIFSDQP